MNGEQPSQRSSVCVFCGQDDTEVCGQKRTNGNIAIHYFCALFSSGLAQNDDQSSGLWGFVESDIVKEARRAHRETFFFLALTNQLCRSLSFPADTAETQGMLVVSVQQYLHICKQQLIISNQMHIINTGKLCGICSFLITHTQYNQRQITDDCV